MRTATLEIAQQDLPELVEGDMCASGASCSTPPQQTMQPCSRRWRWQIGTRSRGPPTKGRLHYGHHRRLADSHERLLPNFQARQRPSGWRIDKARGSGSIQRITLPAQPLPASGCRCCDNRSVRLRRRIPQTGQGVLLRESGLVPIPNEGKRRAGSELV